MDTSAAFLRTFRYHRHVSEDTQHRTPLQRVARGDTAAVNDAITLYGDLVWSLAHTYCARVQDAEDATQDIFIALWRNAHKFDPQRGKEVTFVSIVARRTLIDRWRKQRKVPKPADLSNPASPNLNLSNDTHEPDTFDKMREAFFDLHNDLRVPLRLSVEFGYSHSQIAELTDTPLGTVKTRIRTAINQLKEALKERQRAGGSA